VLIVNVNKLLNHASVSVQMCTNSELLVKKCRADLFRPWIYKFGREIIVHSVKYVFHLLHYYTGRHLFLL